MPPTATLAADPRSPVPTKPSPATAPAAAKLSAPARAMRRLGLVRDIDLALHLPLRYVDETRVEPIASLHDGDTAQVEGEVVDSQIEHGRRRQLVVRLADADGELVLRLLHFYPAQQRALAPGQRVRARGEVRAGYFGREMVHPELRIVAPGAPLPTALTPVYPAGAQLPQAYLRRAVASALARAPLHEVLPPALVPPGLPPLRQALQFLHQPPAAAPLPALDDRSHPAWQRLKFEELLAQQLSQAQAKAARARLRAPVLAARADGVAARLRSALPFALTAAQRRVVAEIDADLGRARPMHRLLQGDVGSGKTVVAALAAATAIDSGWQCALMAPTELLAEQHFAKLVQWLEPLGIRTAWLTGSRKGRVRREQLAELADGRAMLAIGTHAVIQDGVVFARLGLAIVDEQHRFGVAQRLALRAKLDGVDVDGRAVGEGGGRDGDVGGATDARRDGDRHGHRASDGDNDAGGGADAAGRRTEAAPTAATALEPHLLMMSATPIPRTLAMSYFADLDVSTIDELPPGRTPIVTKLLADARRDEVVARIADEIRRGRQVYWVCPLVEESEHLDLQNATATHAALAAALPDVGVGLLHGRLAAAEKAATMAAFTAGALALLVATTVIEVGVDVPNASLMVIEHAERFGLAQLHQLRGRVGRGAVASVCVLLYTAPLSATAKARLRALAETTDGFEIARRDLDIRGPGEFMGARQSGDALLRFADLAEDAPLLLAAREAAAVLLREHPAAADAQVARWMASRADFMKA